MKFAIPLIALLGLSVTTAYANDSFGPRRADWEGMRSQMFAELKNIESISHKERIRILQEADACIQRAANRDQYRSCEERERQAREHSNVQAKAYREALRSRADDMRRRASYP